MICFFRFSFVFLEELRVPEIASVTFTMPYGIFGKAVGLIFYIYFIGDLI